MQELSKIIHLTGLLEILSFLPGVMPSECNYTQKKRAPKKGLLVAVRGILRIGVVFGAAASLVRWLLYRRASPSHISYSL